MLTQGGPRNATDNIYYLIYTYGFDYFDIGRAADASGLAAAALAILLSPGALLRRGRDASG